MKMKASRILAGVLVCGAMCAAHGGTWTWTGAHDGYWTNAANWTVNGAVATRCPGVCSNEIFAADGTTNVGWTTAVSLTDLAEFGTPAAGGATTINLDGYYCVSSITFKAGCPVYTIGTHSNQVIAIESFGASWGTSGRLTVEKDASIPILVAGLSVGMTYKPLQRNSNKAGIINIFNQADGELVISSFGYTRDPCEKLDRVGLVHVYFEGSGGFRFDGPCHNIQQYSQWALWQYPYIYLNSAKPVRFTTPQFGRGKTGSTYGTNDERGPVNIIVGGSCKEVIIEEGCRVSLSDWNYPSLYFIVSAKITGKGTLQLCVQGDKGISGNYANIGVSSGCVGTIECALDFYDSTSRNAKDMRFGGSYNGGTFEVFGPTNMFSGAIWFFKSNTYRSNRIDGFGIATAADTAVYLSSTTSGGVTTPANATIDYAGVGGETFSRDFRFKAANGTATVANTGTGALTLSSTFSPTNGATVALNPDTAPIIFTGSITTYGDAAQIPLIKKGTDTLVIAPEAALPGVGSLRMTAGTVDLSARVNGNTVDFALPVTFDTGENTLILPDDASVTFPSLTATAGQTAGTLNIVGTGRVSVQGKTASDPVPAGLTINGCAAHFSADGALEPNYDVSIAARGDTVPDGDANTVAIMTAGSGNADTIALASTSVKSLLHFCDADAEITIGSGRTLAAETITLSSRSGNLDIGSANDAGTLAGGPNGTLTLKNADTESVLSVNVDIASGTDVRVDATAGKFGTVQLTGGATAHPTIHISEGELRLTGEKPFYLGETFVGTNTNARAMTATLKLDGANVVIGEDPLYVGSGLTRTWSKQTSTGRLIVTNSVVCNSDIFTPSFSIYNTNRAICVGHKYTGVMDIYAGAVITNRLLVGGVYENYHDSASAVHQYGGEMAAIGGKAWNSSGGSYIGVFSGNGYYELNGGTFAMLGSISIGYYGVGSFVQYGGHSVFADHPLSTERTRFGPLAIGNGGNATMRFVGGTCEIHNTPSLTGGETNNGRSRMTIEDTAYVDAGTNSVMITGSTTATGTWTNTADFVICNGGTLRAGGFHRGHTDSASPNFRQVYTVAFNDGTLKLGASGSEIFRRQVTWGSRAVTNAVIYAGGMTLDTDGQTGNYTATPFKGPWGGGVVSVPCEPITGLIAAPVVDIMGDGFGATAVAEFDSATGTMTGVKVVAPGVGYTHATAWIYKLKESSTSVTCVVEPNANTGSFTKKGEGDFTLNAVNTWGGQTILEGGTLRLGVTGALPEGTTVVYNGGELAVAPGVTLDSLTVDIPKISPDTRYALATFEGAAPGTAPAVTIEGVSDPRWQARIGGHKLLLSYTKGTVLIFR